MKHSLSIGLLWILAIGAFAAQERSEKGNSVQDGLAFTLHLFDRWTQIVKLDDEELLKQLASEKVFDRCVAQQELVCRGEKVRLALLRILLDFDQPPVARRAALRMLQSFWNKEVQEACELILDKGDADLRRLAADALGLNVKKGDDEAHNALLQALADDEPEARRAVALAIGRIGAAGSADALVNAIEFDDGKDALLLEGYVRALEEFGKPGIDRLQELADSGVAKDWEKVVEVFLMLRTRAGAEALPTLLQNVHLSDAQRAALLRSYNNYELDPPASVQPVLAYLLNNPDSSAEVKVAGWQVLSLNGALLAVSGSAAILR